jgi:cell fate (sporulation/competence/biofilm development) regulator YmcA (YheA/YmcA/DUF963 family)
MSKEDLQSESAQLYRALKNPNLAASHKDAPEHAAAHERIKEKQKRIKEIEKEYGNGN